MGKFRVSQRVKHVKTGREYEIVGCPPRFKLESGEPVYAYQMVAGLSADVWVRCQQEMEDGRFVLIGGQV